MENRQNSNSESTKLVLNLKEFLAEFFMNRTGEKVQFSYGLFWDAVMDKNCFESIRISTNYEQKEDGSFYYEYGLLKAEEEMESELLITETFTRRVWVYNIYRENAEEPPVSYYFYTKTRIAAFIQHENEVMNLAAEMLEITQQKPILCLESHKSLFCKALNNILEAYSDDYYDEPSCKLNIKITRRLLIGCDMSSDVLTIMKLMVTRLETTSEMQSTRRGPGSEQVT